MKRYAEIIGDPSAWVSARRRAGAAPETMACRTVVDGCRGTWRTGVRADPGAGVCRRR